MKAILTFPIPFEKECNEKLVSPRIVDIVKDVISSDFLTGISAQTFYQYISVIRMMLKHKGVLAKEESLNSDDPGSKSRSISHFGPTQRP